MTATQRLPASLTPLDVALAALLDGLAPVTPVEVPLAEALGCVVAEMVPLKAVPPRDIAAVDGWAFRSRDLVGASSYSPLPLALAPVWVEAGDAMPASCDCVVDSDLIDRSGPMVQVLAEAIPGQGVRRVGGDIVAGALVASGQQLRPLDLLIARAAGLHTIKVRRPRLRVVNIPSRSDATVMLIAESACAAGAEVICTEASVRDAQSIANAIDASACDVLVTIGGTGVGRTDATVAALALRGTLIAHGIALQPGRTTAIGKIGRVPVIALPGAPDQGLAGWWTLALPVLERLAAAQPRPATTLRLARKIASGVGIAEVVLLGKADKAWMPLASGDLSLDSIARADAWLLVSGGSEGFAAGTPVDAYMLRNQ